MNNVSIITNNSNNNTKIINPKLIAMLITINVSFCLFSMPMVYDLKKNN
jgi:hypothetical protein